MTRFFLLFLSVFCSLLDGKLEDHFKPAPNKRSPSFLKGVDFIYTINLDQRPEKFAHCVSELAPYAIVPYRFSAVNGWLLSVDVLNDVGVRYTPPLMEGGHMATYFAPENDGKSAHSPIEVPGRTYFCHCASPGAVGILLSHLSILQDAYDSGYQTVWIMEDDIKVIRNPHLISNAIQELDAAVGQGGWDILFTDKDTKDQQGRYVKNKGYAWRPNFTPKNPERFAKRKKVGSLIKTGARYGAYSMIVRRSGMVKLLHFFKKYNLFLPYDIDFYVPSNMQLYTVSDDIVSTLPTAISDNGAPNFLNQ